MFATAEFAPLVRVGGLAEAASGLVRALRSAGVEVEVVVPDYANTPLTESTELRLDVPTWAGPATARTGDAGESGPVTLITVPGIQKPNPYVDADGQGWDDNPDRFFAFSAAVAALAERRKPDVLHCNDWHTAATLGFLDAVLPSILTIHTLGYQGWTSGGWLDRIPRDSELFEWFGGTNPMAGGIRLADRVIAVSPHYAEEIRSPDGGFGLDEVLVGIGDRLLGIRNGIDASVWDPRIDELIASRFDATDVAGKADCRSDLLSEVGWDDQPGAVAGIVTRLVDQKGIEIALDAIRYADQLPFRLVLLGSGEQGISDHARSLANERPDLLSFSDGYNVAFGHKIFAGSDLLLMPSRFEPCGLAQMQAMAYGTIPVVTDVGGLRDTVVDADRHKRTGNGFVSASVDVASFVDALHRAMRAWKHPSRRAAIQRRGMSTDWSWQTPARDHIEVYESVLA